MLGAALGPIWLSCSGRRSERRRVMLCKPSLFAEFPHQPVRLLVIGGLFDALRKLSCDDQKHEVFIAGLLEAVRPGSRRFC